MYRDRDLLDFTEERIIDQTDTLGEIVDRIHTEVFPRWVPIDPQTTLAELRR